MPWTDHTPDDIRSVCVDFYTDDELSFAISDIAKYYSGEEIPNLNSDDKNKTVEDLMCFLSTVKRGELPTFVAVNLLRLPCMTKHAHSHDDSSNDLAAALQALEQRFTNFTKFASNEFKKVHSDLNHLYSSKDQRPPPVPSPEMYRPASNVCTESTRTNDTQRQQSMPKQLKPNHQQHTNDRESNRSAPPPTCTSPLPPRTSPPSSADKLPEASDVKDTACTNKEQKTTDMPLYSKIVTRVVGTATNNTGLKVSPRPHNIYIGCLDPGTTPMDVIDYVLQYIGIRVPCRQLKTKSELYTSFVITVEKNHLDRVFNPVLWPAEAIIDYYKQPRSARRYGSLRSGATSERSDYQRHKDNADSYYSRKYNQDVYDEPSIQGYGYTGRSSRYPRRSSGDDINDY